MTKAEKIHLIQQIGEYCTTTICSKGCPIKNSVYKTECHNNCVECLRFPDIAEAIAERIKGVKVYPYED